MPIGHSWELEAGQRFNMLTVVSKAPSEGRHNMWLCRCDCGNHTVVRASVLVKGHTKSCGCYRAKKRTGKYNASIMRILEDGDRNTVDLYRILGAEDSHDKRQVSLTLRRLQKKGLTATAGMTRTIPGVTIWHLVRDDEKVKEE